MALSRRNFLKAGGSAALVAGIGASFLGCSTNEPAATPSEGVVGSRVIGAEAVNFTKEVDVLIIGSGYAGLAAAMMPSLAGKNIIIAEKQSQIGGDSTASCCFMFAQGTKLQIDNGLPQTIEEAWEAVKDNQTAGFDQYDWYPEWAKGKYFANTEFVDVAMSDFDAKFQTPATEEELPRLWSRVILPEGGIGTGGKNILRPIANKLEEKGVEFMLNQRAIGLIQDENGAIIGCRFEHTGNGSFTDIKASATVLATGGFADNGEMMAEYLLDWADYAQLVHGAMGEGHKMGVAAGGMLTGMDSSYIYCNLMGDIPNCTTWGYWTPIVLVLPNGKRFIKEDQSHDAAIAAVESGYREWWSIFDQKAFDSRCIAESVEANIKAHADAYVTADTLEELAVKMDVPVDNLVATFARYDELVAGGEDTDQGKKAWLQSLQAPYHALRLNVCRYKTSGGFMVGPNNQVLNKQGEEISGLYAAGAVTTLSYASLSTVMATGFYVGKTLAEL